MKFPIVILVVVGLSESARLPRNFKKCNRAKTDFDVCLLDAVKNAVPQFTRPYKEIDAPNFTPLEINAIDLDIERNKISVKQKLRNCKFSGFNEIQFRVFKIDFENKFMEISGLFPEFKNDCEYEVSGKVIILPIQGKGSATTVAKALDVYLKVPFNETTKNGNTYLHFDNPAMNVTVGDIHFQVDNLFNGDKALGDKMNEFLNENAKEIFEEVKEDYMKLMSDIGLNIMNRIFLKVPVEEVFDG
ncbi:circadian clock-controlled protein daywake-like [Zophobas morio]|uniref:circadian clock-controlled protein daywake-like n=1 Tax=Zophobas morio TaxID=2755281 RepID=UPI003083C2F7